MKAILFALIIAFSASIRILDHIPNGSEEGVDVCSYDGSINWVKVKNAGIKFAILRTTVKNGTMDSTFETNYKNAKAAGIEVSGYHFSYSLTTDEAKKAATNLYNKLNGKKLTIWLDLEWENQGKLSKQKVTDIAKAFINQMKSYGYTTHIYSNKDWYLENYYIQDIYYAGSNENYCKNLRLQKKLNIKEAMINAYNAIKEKVNDYFVRCKMVAFNKDTYNAMEIQLDKLRIEIYL